MQLFFVGVIFQWNIFLWYFFWGIFSLGNFFSSTERRYQRPFSPSTQPLPKSTVQLFSFDRREWLPSFGVVILPIESSENGQSGFGRMSASDRGNHCVDFTVNSCTSIWATVLFHFFQCSQILADFRLIRFWGTTNCLYE